MSNETESLPDLLARLREQEPEITYTLCNTGDYCWINSAGRHTGPGIAISELLERNNRTRSRLLAALEALEHMLGYINILRDTKKHSGSSNLLIGEIAAKLSAVLKEGIGE